MPDNSVKYNDLLFRIILALVAAHIIVSFGATESFFQLLLDWYYYRALLLSFIIAYLLINEVYFATIKLDRHFDWKDEPVQRAGLQVLFGWFLPSLTAFILAAAYFAVFGYNILKTNYPSLIFPVIVILLLLLNVYYLAFYFFRQWQRFEKNSNGSTQADSKVNREIFMVQKGAKVIPLKTEAIGYFYHDGDYNFIRTFDREDFVISQPLDDIERQLPPKQFFRINRQVIVNISSCRHFELMDFGRLKLDVQPEMKQPVIVSQKRARQFKLWMEQHSA